MKKGLSAVIFILLNHLSFSQSSRLSERNTIGWFTTIITPALSKKISLHGEYQWRRVNFLKHWQQSLVRTGITYKITPQVAVQVGYAWAPTFPYGTYTLSAVPKVFPEHRIYEQIVLNSTIGKAALTNRFRLEQRWIGRFASIDAEKPVFVFLNRFRFMPRLDYPLSQKWYAAAYNEILIGFGENVGENIFDQNRISAMIGYKPSNLFRIEAGFINQTVQLGREIENKNVIQYNNGIILNTYLNF
ncbi:DUF2490 domain-containing protein [Segetibacter sp.]|jgi:hypothetical protein|uniref:DUF2490 domain-containing protein n=1 Tax=Segetibacter sp. TaxID=2231182 RepID=UPI0026173B6E|nr:DUF2490 domain-containing protein [Segetibacter sp.]MCW3082066.1 hypothetical protein [Segetibacter sp.]